MYDTSTDDQIVERRSGVIEEFNRTDHDFPAEECLPDLLREQARLRPGDAAVLHGDESLGFGELLAGATDVAAYLRHLGVAPDDCVGLFVEPSAELMVGGGGILLAGGADLRSGRWAWWPRPRPRSGPPSGCRCSSAVVASVLGLLILDQEFNGLQLAGVVAVLLAVVIGQLTTPTVPTPARPAVDEPADDTTVHSGRT